MCMKKRIFIVHGWSGKPDEHWLPWLKNQLEQRGFEVHVPRMSQNDDPIISEWVQRLGDAVGISDENTFFVGHSIGCQTIMRYLASGNKKAGGCVFVAGWFKLENLPEEEIEVARPWEEEPIDYQVLLMATENFVVLISDNDDYDAVEENSRRFREDIKAEVHIMHNMGHFTSGDGVVQLPQALEAVLKFAT